RLDPRDQPDLPTVMPDSALATLPPQAIAEVFEPLLDRPVVLRPAHNTIGFWTWGDSECCLAAGATAATLRDAWAEPDNGGDQNHNHGHDGHDHDGHDHDHDHGHGHGHDDHDHDHDHGHDDHDHHGHDHECRPRKRQLHLVPGDILIVEEVVGPQTGAIA